MAGQVFPYHLAGFAVGAFTTGYCFSSLIHCLARKVVPIEETVVDANVPPLIHKRKRKRDAEITPLHPIKRRIVDAGNTSLSANRKSSSEDLNAPLTDLITTTSDSNHGGLGGTNGDVSSRPAHYIQLRSHPSTKTSVHELKLQLNGGNLHTTISWQNKMASKDAVVLETEDKTDEEDYHSDLTIIGDDFEYHDEDSDESDGQNKNENRSRDHDDEDDDLDDQIEDRHDSGSHDIDLVNNAETVLEPRNDNGDDGDTEEKERKDGRANDEAIRIHL